jgi:hypothetical protein
MFTIQKSHNGLPCIHSDNLSNEQFEAIRAIITNPHIESIEYRLRIATGAYLNGYQRYSDGSCWVMVEFWGNGEVEEIVKLINERIG